MLKIEDFIFETCIGKGGTSEVYLGFFLLYIVTCQVAYSQAIYQ